jgi:hypothetical protein
MFQSVRLLCILVLTLSILATAPTAAVAGSFFNLYGWTRVNPAALWAPRTGLESVELG